MSTNPLLGWRGAADGTPTTMVLLRHGVTASTQRKLFSGSGGADPSLTDEGQAQAARAAAWIANHHQVDALIASPLARTQQTASFVAATTGHPVRTEPGIVEAAFGEWDGYSFSEVAERWPTELQQWLSSTATAPPGGESFDDVDARVADVRERLLSQSRGRTIVVVSHVTPIKLLVRQALDVPISVIYKMELAPASISTIQTWPDGAPAVRNFSVVPE